MEREEMQGTRKITKWMGKNGQRCQVSAKSLVHQWSRGSVSSLLPRRAGGLMQLEHVGTCWNMLEHVGTCWNMLEHVGTCSKHPKVQPEPQNSGQGKASQDWDCKGLSDFMDRRKQVHSRIKRRLYEQRMDKK